MSQSTIPRQSTGDSTIPTDSDGWPVVAEHGLDWGDISLIRAQLELSPTERLRAAERFAYDAESLRNARRV